MGNAGNAPFSSVSDLLHILVFYYRQSVEFPQWLVFEFATINSSILRKIGPWMPLEIDRHAALAGC